MGNRSRFRRGESYLYSDPLIEACQESRNGEDGDNGKPGKCCTTHRDWVETQKEKRDDSEEGCPGEMYEKDQCAFWPHSAYTTSQAKPGGAQRKQQFIGEQSTGQVRPFLRTNKRNGENNGTYGERE